MPLDPPNPRRIDWRRAGLYGGISLVALLLPLWLARSNSAWIGATDKSRQVFELFGFTESLALLLILALEARRHPWRNTRRAIIALAPLLLSFLLLGFLVEGAAEKSWDYRCYEEAAQALWQGKNPYEGTAYLYPPLTAEALAAVHGVVAWSHGARTVTGEARWLEVFYLFQASQLFLVQLVYLLLTTWLRQLRVPRLRATLFSALLLAINNPLLRTLEFNQVNLWVLLAVLATLVGFRQAPWVSGLALACGAHIKLYPLLMGGALALLRRFKALGALVIGSVAILAAQLGWSEGVQTWQQFIAASRHFPETSLYRDSSLKGIVGKLAERLLPAADTWVPSLVVVLSMLVLFWLLRRYLHRRRGLGSADAGYEATLRVERETLVDAVSAMLLLSPMVWEHHYVLALPVAAHALATRRHQHPRAVWLGTLLLFALPTFDVFLASSHRLVGLLMLVWATEPRKQ